MFLRLIQEFLHVVLLSYVVLSAMAEDFGLKDLAH